MWCEVHACSHVAVGVVCSHTLRLTLCFSHLAPHTLHGCTSHCASHTLVQRQPCEYDGQPEQHGPGGSTTILRPACVPDTPVHLGLRPAATASRCCCPAGYAHGHAGRRSCYCWAIRTGAGRHTRYGGGGGGAGFYTRGTEAWGVAHMVHVGWAAGLSTKP